ncbi:MAG: hypothetical protein ACJAYJ_001325 [Saprospiraceae bacterium]|jgi:hypothetical protein
MFVHCRHSLAVLSFIYGLENFLKKDGKDKTLAAII